MKTFLKALLFATITVLPATSFAAVFISVTVAPPPLPVYVQPVCPGPQFIWTPGYWAYGPDGYYWVPGTWVRAPVVGYLWTPGWWGWSEGVYVWHAGYWAPHVGFYGGINYGYGYTGEGYYGGRWNNGVFVYNRAVNHIDVTYIHNTYNQTIVERHVTVTRISYNGGAGGIAERPTPAQRAYLREEHVAPLPQQVRHQRLAAADRAQLETVNHGQPALAATQRPGFSVAEANSGARRPRHPAQQDRPRVAPVQRPAEPRFEVTHPRAPERSFREAPPGRQAREERR